MKSYKLIMAVLSLAILFASCNYKNKTKSAETAQKEIVTPAKSLEQMAVFYQSALEGNIDLIRQYLNEGVDVNSMDENKRTALMLASFNGHINVVRLLLDNGADIKMVDDVNRTALMFASTGPFNETVVELINAGSEVNATDSHENWTPFMFAAGEGQLEVVKTLIANGADKTMVDIDGESALDFARTKGHQKVVEYLEKQ